MTQPSQEGRQPLQEQGEAQARLAAIVESSDDAIVSKTLTGVVTSWNKGAQRIFGYTAAEMVGRPISVLFPPERLNEEPQILARLHRGERVDHFETVRVTKDGRLVDVSVTISPVRDATGKIVGASKIARDITGRKQAERDLRAARDAAESANKAKDHFLSVLSHELRTPLTPVLAAVSLIQETPDLPAAELAGHVGMIRRNIETEARLVDDLLDVTRIARGKVRLQFEEVDAHAAVRNVVGMLQSDVDAKGLAVTLALRAKDHQVWADPGRFQQVLLNLLTNAVKFTPEEGTITVRTANEAGRSLKIEVSDSGAGIEPDVLPRLFRPFEQGERTVTRKFGGLGLGLSIVRSLVEMHGGSIAAASDGAGKGATFALRVGTVERDAARQAASPAMPAVPAAAADATKRLRVLVVEDHDDTRKMLGLMLRSFGFDVTAAGTVREAVALADGQAFDLLLSDIGLPDGSGHDVMRHVRGRQNIRGIALSGFGQDDDLRRSQEAGFEQHLTKPINLQTLREAVAPLAG
ncbi:MAG: Chemotaxis protein methyltransferase CheR [Phycisphaerales bacterium]|nr:Chemotaxis protein methyltransferase CheR [Phycisphaerales bacterium]